MQTTEQKRRSAERYREKHREEIRARDRERQKARKERSAYFREMREIRKKEGEEVSELDVENTPIPDERELWQRIIERRRGRFDEGSTYYKDLNGIAERRDEK